MANSVEFVRIFVYGGKKEMDLVDTRVRMYKKQSKKKTSSLPPNPNSLRYYILRTHHLAFIWKRCLYAIVVPLPLNENGWKEDNVIVVPIWYKCSQLPPSTNKKNKSGYIADVEDVTMIGESFSVNRKVKKKMIK